MAILIAHDLDTFNFVMRHSRKLDFCKKNLNDENVTSLYLKITESSVNGKMEIQRQSSFDYKYVDPIYKNTALIFWNHQ